MGKINFEHAQLLFFPIVIFLGVVYSLYYMFSNWQDTLHKTWSERTTGLNISIIVNCLVAIWLVIFICVAIHSHMKNKK